MFTPLTPSLFFPDWRLDPGLRVMTRGLTEDRLKGVRGDSKEGTLSTLPTDSAPRARLRTPRDSEGSRKTSGVPDGRREGPGM